MSWKKRENAYDAFTTEATNTPMAVAFPQWMLHVWEVTHDHPEGRWYLEPTARCLRVKAKLRIVFAPLDLPRRDALPQTIEMFQILGVPSEFTTERLQSVSHSFGRNTDRNGSSTWFHFLCKNIDIRQDGDSAPEVDNRAAKMRYHVSTLPQADYSWHRAGFFLRVESDGSATLVCFGASSKVRQRIAEFVNAKVWEHVAIDPYILFDLLLDGLYLEVDETVWRMNTVFGPLEHMILQFSTAKGTRKMSSKIPFAAMHNCAKHIIHIAEALESCLMLVESTIENIGNHEHLARMPSQEPILKQLRESLKYRRSLFRSSQLRLNSLQKRIDNAITLSFNLVTQQDSMVMIQDSNSMKVIAAITMVFLPTTGVATIIGSQLFLSEVHKDQKTWDVKTTPLFWTMWWISIPLTIFVAILAMFWHWWNHSEQKKAEVVHVVKRAATFGSSTGKKK
ncbi:Fc.00g002570.m01.CDS01 [Cosmosporella sp. VM-42]